MYTGSFPDSEDKHPDRAVIADREAAIRGLLEEVIVILHVPHPAHHDDDDLYVHACELRIDTVIIAFRHLAAGTIDNTAVQETARVLHGVAGDLPVSYPVAS